MTRDLSEAWLRRLVQDAEPESLTLEFKASGSLVKSEGARMEITKDVSAMANADGGRIIYGIAERRDGKQRGIASDVDPIDSSVISVEWLDQVLGMIRPKIAGVAITPVPVGAGLHCACYVVDVPAGLTAHQALDRRYYQRSNARVEPMYDYQIRDVMARGDHPRVTVEIELRQRSGGLYMQSGSGERSEVVAPTHQMWVWLRNDGARLARFVNGWIEIPAHLLPEGASWLDVRVPRGFRSAAEVRRVPFENQGIIEGPPDVLTTGTMVPLLPGLTRFVASIPLNGIDFLARRHDAMATWQVHADNAPVQRGELPLNGDIVA